MKLIIAGGRDYQLTESDYQKLDAIPDVSEVVSGGARGADSCGEKWAKSNRIPLKVFPADWAKHGKRAGPIRNHGMAVYAEAVALFPGGRGTQDMWVQAKAQALTIFDFRAVEVQG